MLGVSFVGGVGRFWMRQLLNGVSRWIEYDLRNDLFQTAGDRSMRHTYTRMRTGDLMARLTNDLSAVRMAVGPGDHVSRRTRSPAAPSRSASCSHRRRASR